MRMYLREINITARKWAYEPKEIIVKQGERVVIHAKSLDVRHSFSLPDFGKNEFGLKGIKALLEPNKETVIEFAADKKGEFLFGCDVVTCGDGHTDMLGKLIVK